MVQSSGYESEHSYDIRTGRGARNDIRGGLIQVANIPIRGNWLQSKMHYRLLQTQGLGHKLLIQDLIIYFFMGHGRGTWEGDVPPPVL